MEQAGMMDMLCRIACKFGLTFLIFSGLVLLWLRPEGASLGMMWVILAVNAATVLLSVAGLRMIEGKRRNQSEKRTILAVLEQKKQEETDEK